MDSETPEKIQQLLSDLTLQAKSYGGSASDEDFFRRQDMLQKAKQLVQDLSTPEEVVFNLALSIAEVIAIRILLRFDVFSHLPADGNPISLDEISKAVDVQASLIERLFRSLVLTHVVEQVGGEGGSYRHTRISKAFTTEHGPQYLIMTLTDEYGKPMMRFNDYLDVRGSPYNEPNDPKRNPYSWGNNRDGEDNWTIMSSYPDRIKTFQKAIASYDKAVPVIGDHYDYNKFKTDEPDRIELVDVGGGHGRVLKEIISNSPALSSSKCVLQDVENVINLAKEIGGLPSDVVTMVHNFNTDQPVKGAKAYHFRFIMHDYSDDVNINILSKIAAVMAPDSVLLIAEMVLPQQIKETDTIGLVMDNVMLMLGGKERTEPMYEKLLEASGLEMVHVYRAPRGPGAIIEARLKR